MLLLLLSKAVRRQKGEVTQRMKLKGGTNPQRRTSMPGRMRKSHTRARRRAANAALARLAVAAAFSALSVLRTDMYENSGEEWEQEKFLSASQSLFYGE